MINPNQDRWTAFEQMIEDARATEEKVADAIFAAKIALPVELRMLIEWQGLELIPQAIRKLQN